ncbi:MAG: hypothetical protein DHS20C16_35480 [Phycisphaerae bacterium]|nr:MAG: hypothetical protein DHS20C16_35480 [Phycisphaerae bacterium]
MHALPRFGDRSDHLGEFAEVIDGFTLDLLGENQVKQPIITIQKGDAFGRGQGGKGR